MRIEGLQSETAGEAGEALGGLIGAVGGALSEFWGAIGPTVGAFFDGVARGAGLQDASWIAWAALILGALAVLKGVRSVIDGAILSGAIIGLIGVALAAWAIG